MFAISIILEYEVLEGEDKSVFICLVFSTVHTHSYTSPVYCEREIEKKTDKMDIIHWEDDDDNDSICSTELEYIEIRHNKVLELLFTGGDLGRILCFTEEETTEEAEKALKDLIDSSPSDTTGEYFCLYNHVERMIKKLDAKYRPNRPLTKEASETYLREYEKFTDFLDHLSQSINDARNLSDRLEMNIKYIKTSLDILKENNEHSHTKELLDTIQENLREGAEVIRGNREIEKKIERESKEFL